MSETPNELQDPPSGSQGSAETGGAGPGGAIRSSLGPLSKRGRWAALALAAIVYLVPGPPKFADALSLPVVLTQARANGVVVDGTVRNALNRAALVYDSRTDLQGVFGAGEAMNVHAFIEWAIARPDSSATHLRPFESTYRSVLDQWAAAAAPTAGVGVPTNGAPGLPGA